ncbi:MAG TPA: S8 family serine peptidase [Candidatus Syntrophosphaera sp.]|jgi:subtilisin family serine protease|nr:S8 family serine peptidase [Candidatus Cloacimonadota bacterium]HOR03617.1 S8 family serine peptidase [Candidatus Syntrophosphaera sp.]HPK83443.1 S8 family serine peptidase [Candidatus Syntrophosphaera sp.]HQG94760.1 S8 family serine peptidase [Candidatus Syntrophosphaera sp.]HQK29617.1 S8 family serine peptidase [Candidatus Syntrophosphaera sp.]
MKKLILLTLLTVAVSAMFALKFDPDYFYSRSVIVCFTKDAVGNDTGKIDWSLQNGRARTGLSSFDELAAEYGIVELQQMHPYVKVPTWNDNGIYLQNTYRLILESDDRIDAAVDALSKDKNLIYAELEGIARTKFVPNDPMVTQQYVHTRIQSFDAWDYIQGSFDVKVAITDSGVKWNHPDLRGNIWVNPAESPGMTINWDAGTISGGDGADAGEGGNKIDDLIGWDFFNNDNNPMQTYISNDHGTHVAGCAGAVGNNSIGLVGTSPIVSIISCKGASNTSPSQGISYAYDQIKYSAEVGAHIINASWGSPGNGAYPNSIVNYATALGALVVTAAGNDNTEHNSSYQDYPADCTNALCVASTGQNDIKSNFSDFGAPIDICAPGEGILSTIIAGNGYDAYDGTSMASPVAAGVCALVKALHPELTPAQLMQRVMMTSDYIYEANPDYVGKLGAGRINAFTATMFDKIPNITVDDTTVEEFEGDGDGVPNPGETIKLKVSLNNYLDPFTGLAWMTATGLNATLTTSYPGITIIDDTASYGNLTPGSTMWNNSQPFKFQTVAGLPSEPIPFELVVTANPTAPFPYTKTIPFQVNLSLVQSGWPVALGGASNSSAILYNLDSNPDREVIFGDPSGKIHAVKADGSSVAGFPINVGSAVIGSIAMGDVDNNGVKDFAAGFQNNNIMLFGPTGNTIWTVPAGGTLRNGPVMADLANNGQSKVIAVTQTGSLVVLNADGSPYPNFPVSLGGACLGTPAVADLNGDGIHEILVATLNGTLHAINSATGQNIAGFPVTMPSGSQNPITIANLDSDNHPEIIVTTSTSGHILAYNHDGTVHFQKSVGGQIKTGAVVADVNNDGNKEIIVIGAAGVVNVLTTAGADLPGTPINVGQAVECTPTVAYFDGDNMAGIIFGDTNGYVHSVRIDGTESPNFPLRINGNVKTSAALGDIDLDGDLDIVIPNDASFYVIDVKRPAQSIPWHCYLGTYNRAGNSYQTTPVADNSIPELNTRLHGNFPNPFNPSTVICFELAESGPVTLEIYNQKGQLVSTLVDANLPAGNHSAAWNGTDASGDAVSSGVYFYRMRSGAFSSTRKMVLMK